MKLFFTVLFGLVSTLAGYGQLKTRQASWQQKVDYNMEVILDPETKSLRGDGHMHYHNNSPDTLRSIWMHVWINAYANDQTAFAKQQIRNGKTDFHFSKVKERGNLVQMSFLAGKDALSYEFHPEHKDIVKLNLPEPLLPGSDIRLKISFINRLPKLFSRGGYKDSFYAITQWYPKPAVYDVNGWNIMPYLDQGEFYSEYGDYSVNILAPVKYTVASTGHLVSTVSSNTYTVHRYEEENIHDFAWFAAKDFRIAERNVLIGRDSVLLRVYSSGRMENYSKEDPLDYLEKGVVQYSRLVGPYPYRTCTVVVGPLEAGGGMEYPTITICNSYTGSTIVHEVGHNWFYGMLGTNERMYPWMDESINTFYEQLISGKFRNNDSFFKRISNRQWLSQYENQLAYLFSSRQGYSQPLNLRSEEFINLNYGAIVYAKGPLVFAYLRHQLGDSVFTKCVRDYFREWKFRHPLPGDMQAIFEKSSGMKLDWFFVDLLNENNDIDLVKKGGRMKLEGSRALDSFLALRHYRDANPNGFLPEKNYINNGRKLKPVSFAFPFSLPRYHTVTAVNVCPAIGFNYYDKYYAGAVLFNRTLFRNRFEYILMPAYSFRNERMIGYGRLNLHLLTGAKRVYKVEGGLQGQSFGARIGQINQYYRLNPYVRLYIKRRDETPWMKHRELHLNVYHTGMTDPYNHYADTNGMAFRVALPTQYFSNYLRLSHLWISDHPIYPYHVKWHAEYAYNYKFGPLENTYLKTWVNAWFKYVFAARNKFFKTDFFAGVFLMSKGGIDNRRFYLSGNNGNNDYTYSEAMLGRNEGYGSEVLLGRQVIDINGNMRNILPLPGTDKWMLALANEVSLPGFIPLRIYLDLGYYPSTVRMNNTLVYTDPELYTTAGVLLPLFKGRLEFFAPFYQSSQFDYNMARKGFLNSIGFKLRLNALDPFRMIDDFKAF